MVDACASVLDLVDHYIYRMLNDLVSPAITRNWIICQNKQKYIRDLLCTSQPCTRRHVSCNSAHFPHSTTLANESLRIPTTSLSNISNQVINSGKQDIDIGLPHLLLYNCKEFYFLYESVSKSQNFLCSL